MKRIAMVMMICAFVANDGWAQMKKAPPVQVKIKTTAGKEIAKNRDKGKLAKTETQTVSFTATLANPSPVKPVEKISLKLFVVAGSHGFDHQTKDYVVVEVLEQGDITVEARASNKIVEMGVAEFKKEENQLGGGWTERDGLAYEGYLCQIFHNGELVGSVDSGGKNVREAAANYKPPEDEEE